MLDAIVGHLSMYLRTIMIKLSSDHFCRLSRSFLILDVTRCIISLSHFICSIFNESEVSVFDQKSLTEIVKLCANNS